jgi:hypothetical protein
MTITQKKKGWWKIWLLLAIIAALIIVAVILYYVGIDYISWIGYSLRDAKRWASESWVSAGIESLVWVSAGGGFVWLYYNYLRGQKVTNVAGTNVGSGYAPAPTYPTAQPNQDKETTIS